MAPHNLRVLDLHRSADLHAELDRIDAQASSSIDQLAQASFRSLKLEQVPARLARFLYQELVLEGGAVVLPAQMDDRSSESVSLLLFGTRYQLQHLAVRIRTQTSASVSEEGADLNQLSEELERALQAYDHPLGGALKIGPTSFAWNARTYVMGIVNVTSDSFSGDGIMAHSHDYVDQAVAAAERQLADGADIVDIGGESTRPGSQPVPTEEERLRVIPVIESLRRKTHAPISIDTYKAEIASEALDAGADLINDVWGLRMDAEMKRIVARRGVPVVIMHNRSQPKDAVQSQRLGGRYVGVEYGDLLADVIRELRDQIGTALDAGISPEKIIVDPGIGFGKTVEQNLELVDRLAELRVLGLPILLGPSRKGFVGFTLDLPVDQRVEGTAAAVALGIERGANIVRVHDVKAIARVARMTDAVLRKK